MTILHYALAVVASAGAIVALAAAATAAPASAVSHDLAYLGQKSIAIYLLHQFFIAVHLMLLRLGVMSGPLHLAVATGLGLAGPLLAAAALRLQSLTGGWL